MTPAMRGLLIAALHVTLVLGVGGRYLWDREHLPRGWARTAPFDPDLPIRGRYVSLALEIPLDGDTATVDTLRRWESLPVRLAVREGRVVATHDAGRGHLRAFRTPARGVVRLADQVLFFIPEHADDPSRQPPGKRLWAEVSVPPEGPPRVVRVEARGE